MKLAWVAGALVALTLTGTAFAEGPTKTTVRRDSPTETTIVIHGPARPKAQASKQKAEPEFREYDLGEPARAYALPARQSAPPSGETYAQDYEPGPNGVLTRGAGMAPVTTTFALSPPWYGGYGYGYGGYATGVIGPGPVVTNYTSFPWPNQNPFVQNPYISPYPGPQVPIYGPIQGQVTVYPPPVILRVP